LDWRFMRIRTEKVYASASKISPAINPAQSASPLPDKQSEEPLESTRQSSPGRAPLRSASGARPVVRGDATRRLKRRSLSTSQVGRRSGFYQFATSRLSSTSTKNSISPDDTPVWSNLCVFLQEYTQATEGQTEAPQHWHAETCKSVLTAYFQEADRYLGETSNKDALKGEMKASYSHRKYGCVWFKTWCGNIETAIGMDHSRFLVFTKVDGMVGISQSVEWLFLRDCKRLNPYIDVRTRNVETVAYALKHANWNLCSIKPPLFKTAEGKYGRLPAMDDDITRESYLVATPTAHLVATPTATTRADSELQEKCLRRRFSS